MFAIFKQRFSEESSSNRNKKSSFEILEKETVFEEYDVGVNNIWNDELLTYDGKEITSNMLRYYEVMDSLLTGQGGGVPLENTWKNHALVLYRDKVYDPSYGVCYGTYSNKEYLTLFISNLESIGYTKSGSRLGYGFIYEPKKTSTEISISDFGVE